MATEADFTLVNTARIVIYSLRLLNKEQWQTKQDLRYKIRKQE